MTHAHTHTHTHPGLDRGASDQFHLCTPHVPGVVWERRGVVVELLFESECGRWGREGGVLSGLVKEDLLIYIHLENECVCVCVCVWMCVWSERGRGREGGPDFEKEMGETRAGGGK
jgi:hypothetical protein